MKRILTLAIGLGAIVSTQAQSSHSYHYDRNDSRDVILGNRTNQTYEKNSRYNSYNFNERDRDLQIDRINREYDYRIRDVKRDRWMRSSQKHYQVQRLEDQRRSEIRQVWERFRDSRNGYSNNRRNDRRW